MEEVDFNDFVMPEQNEGMSDNITGKFSFKQVGSITKYVEPVSGENTIDMIVEMFQEQPDLMAIPC